MIFTSDLVIKDPNWRKLANLVVDKHQVIGNYVELFIICTSIGICDGVKEESVTDEETDYTPLNLPRNVLSRPENNDNLDFLYESYVFAFEKSLSTEDKINLAFKDDETVGMKKIEQLRLCANYGMRIMLELLKNYDDEYIIMEEILNLLKDKVLDRDELVNLLLEDDEVK